MENQENRGEIKSASKPIEAQNQEQTKPVQDKLVQPQSKPRSYEL